MWSSRLFFGQIFQAATGFLVPLMWVRSVGPEAFVAISIAWLVLVALVNAQRVLVGEQCVVARSQGEELLDDMRLMIASAVCAGVILGLVAVPLERVVGPLDAATFLLIAMLIVINDAARYACISVGRTARLLVADIAVGLVSVGAFAWVDVWRSAEYHWFFVALAVALASSVMCLGGVRAPSLGLLVRFVRGRRRFAGWTAIQLFLVNTAAQFTLVIALPFTAAVDFAGARALQSLFSPLSTPATAMQPQMLRWVAGSEPQAPHELASAKFAVRWGMGWAGLFLILALCAWGTADHWISVVIGAQYQNVGAVSLPIVWALAAVYIGLPAGTILRVRRLALPSIKAQSLAVALGAIVIFVGSLLGGIHGAMWGVALQMFIGSGLAWRAAIHAKVRQEIYG